MVLFVVLLPWILIAIPSTNVGGGGTTGVNVDHSVYGWPFVHLDSTEYQVPDWLNRNFTPAQKSAGRDLTKTARESAKNYLQDKSQVRLNLRFERDVVNDRELDESGYWTESANWPVPKTGKHFTPRYVGLVLNLIVVALLVGVVAALCEYRIRRNQRLLKYSIASLLVGMALLAVCINSAVEIYRENDAQDSLQVLARKEGNTLWDIETRFQPRFPTIVSQLLNHGKHPWGKMVISQKLKSGNIKVDIDQGSDPQKIKLIARCVKQTGHSVDLKVFDFSPDRQKMLNQMREANIVALYLDFDGADWSGLGIGDGSTDARGELERKGSGCELDLRFDKRNLKEIRLNMDSKVSPKKQLEPFLGLPSLQWASVTSLSTEGAEFIFETKAKWPRVMEFGFQDEVAGELRQKLESEFEGIPEQEGGE